jgi:UDP-glucose 4-epimerase
VSTERTRCARALVTGGAGFIGRHLAGRLAQQGCRVVVLDDLSTGSAAAVAGLADRYGVRFVPGSVVDGSVVDTLVSEVDTVFHLAAAVGVRRVLAAPLAGLRTNIHGTEQVLAAAHRHGARVLLASTSEIYGKNTAAPLAEDADRVLGSPLLARWSYAEAKAVDESMAQAYWREHRVWTVVARLFNVVGPGQTGRYGMVLPRFVDQALRGEPLTVYGDGGQTRCFCDVGEAAAALIALAAAPAARGRAVNVGRPEEVSILDLAGRVITLSGSTSRVRLVPYAEAYGDGFEDMRRRVPDISLAGELIGFRPRVGLDDIIRGVLAARRAEAAADAAADPAAPQAAADPAAAATGGRRAR